MGRTRTFAEEEVIRSARRVFWEQGYAETAVPDLEAATGLRRSSLYHAFGSKRGLFDAAVESYLDEVVRPRMAPLRADPVAPDALETYLSGLRGELLAGPGDTGTQGCLLMNAAGSSLGHDDALRVMTSRYYDDLRAALAAGVRARHPRLDADAVQALTTTLAALVLSSMAIVRIEVRLAVEVLETALRTVASASN